MKRFTKQPGKLEDGTEGIGEKQCSVHRESCPEETYLHSKSLGSSPKGQDDILFPVTPPTQTLSAQPTPTLCQTLPIRPRNGFFSSLNLELI